MALVGGTTGGASGSTSLPIATQFSLANSVPVTRQKVNLSRLTLESGMTADYGVPPHGAAENPKAFRGTYGGNPDLQPLRVGILRSVPGLVTSKGGKIQTYAMYFIFNPTEIVASFVTNVNNIPPQYVYGGSGTGALPKVPNVTNAQTVSWSLIFDRTYDMLYGGDARGVLADVAALYSLMGSFESTSGVPMATLCQVVFGKAGTHIWGFTGFISSATITYGIFRKNMMPARCQVDLQMTTVYVSDQVTNKTTKSSSSNFGTLSKLSAAGARTVGAARKGEGGKSVSTGTFNPAGKFG